MKDSHLYLFMNFCSLDIVVGVADIKEKFIKNSFIEEAHILLYLSEDLTQRKTILYEKIKHNLIKNQEYSVQRFTQEFSEEIKSIYDYKKINNISLSWLEIFQVAVMLKESQISDKNIDSSIKKLDEFKKIIFQKY